MPSMTGMASAKPADISLQGTHYAMPCVSTDYQSLTTSTYGQLRPLPCSTIPYNCRQLRACHAVLSLRTAGSSEPPMQYRSRTQA